jgi:predicted PurR-regulated permease PerM
MKALYFVIFALALQQLDGNVIGPKILGGQTGLSSLWVIIAILVGGSFFGLPGMFFGVPVCACLYSAVSFLVNSRLRAKDLPVDTAAYGAGHGEGREPGAADGEKR